MTNLPQSKSTKLELEQLLKKYGIGKTYSAGGSYLIEALEAYVESKVLEGRKLEAKWWEYNIIPAVRNAQTDHDVNKRLAELEATPKERGEK